MKDERRPADLAAPAALAVIRSRAMDRKPLNGDDKLVYHDRFIDEKCYDLDWKDCV